MVLGSSLTLIIIGMRFILAYVGMKIHFGTQVKRLGVIRCFSRI